MSERKTDGGKSDRIPGASTPASLSAYEAGYAGIQWGDGVDETHKVDLGSRQYEGRDFDLHENGVVDKRVGTRLFIAED